MTYEWDLVKAGANLARHQVTFEEAASVFLDPLALTFSDPDHSDEEDREITIGRSSRKRVVFVAHASRERPCPDHQRAAGHPPGAETVWGRN